MQEPDAQAGVNQPEKTQAGELVAEFDALVIGDWLVDEHWVVGKHRAVSSSRTGHEHSRALHRDGCSVRSLCGAGQVATVLAQARLGDSQPFRINGIGIWHPGDSEILKRMLDPTFNISRTPHRLAYEEAGDGAHNSHVNLYTLTPKELGVVAGTTRVIRIYRHVSDQIELDQRIDWELPLTQSDGTTIRKGIHHTLKDLRSRSTIKHIFVKDLGRGAVTEELIKWLHVFKDASWYVSSKAWCPDWYRHLPKARVKLLLIPQLAAQQAIDKGVISSSSWLTAAGVPSQDAMKAIDGFVERFGSAKIVVLPEGMGVLGRDGNNCYVLPPADMADSFPYTPMASVFFPALASHLLATRIDFFQALKKAVSFTSLWRRSEAQRTAIDTWVPTPDQVLSLDAGADPLGDAQGWLKFNWQDTGSQWKQAFSEFGIVTVSGSKHKKEPHQTRQFHLWRAMTDIQGYVTCIPSKRRHVLALLREARSLQHASVDERSSKSFFIVDQPGSGKSFLVNCLASTLAMPCLKFNISALSKREDLNDCFQRISAAQSEHSHSTQILFFDEMNAKKDGQRVYDAFLGPLEDGTYYHNGRTFHLKPCFWIFAGTEAPARGETEEHISDKGLDFESRLSHPVMYLNGSGSDTPEISKEDLDRLRKLEQVYIGVATIRAVFPDVTKVSSGVLEAFHHADSGKVGLPDSAKGPRGIRRFVRSLRYVQYGRVTGDNLPEGWHNQLGIGDELYQKWKQDEARGRELVDIRTRAEV